MNSVTMQLDNNRKAFFELLKAGLWEREVLLSQFGKIDYMEVLQLAEEQSVVGLVAAGLEHVIDVKVPQEDLLQFIGQTIQIEQRNRDMNEFVAQLIGNLRKQDVYAILVKGQGIAQCYEKPLWRSSGDVDLLLSDDNYRKAKSILIPKASSVEQEYASFKHVSMMMDGDYEVELHGTLHTRLSKRVDRGVDSVQNDVFCGGNVRSWINGSTSVFLPSPDNDVIFVFTHILHHFYVEGIGIRQFCDWCRLLWTYRDSLNHGLLESRIQKLGLMTEWKAFAAFSVEYLGMPISAMPLLSEKESLKLRRKAEHILTFVLESGNFGHKREREISKSYMGGKLASTFRKLKDFGHHMRIFPIDSVKFFCYFALDGIGGAMRGE